MLEMIRAVFKDGKFEPLDEIAIEEGAEVTLIVTKAAVERDFRAFHEAAGAWKDIVDCDQLIEDVYTSRLVHTREEPKL